MLIGHVSGEQYVAVPDALIQLDRDDWCVVRTSPRGEVHADVPDGTYRVTLTCRGYGSKSITIRLPDAAPYMFRLLSDGLLGYM